MSHHGFRVSIVLTEHVCVGRAGELASPPAAPFFQFLIAQRREPGLHVPGHGLL